MAETRVIDTRSGGVEVMVSRGNKPPVLFFPGGHCTAATDCGWKLYTSLGYGIVAFSRPGYGRTDVGALSATEFVPALQDCCRSLGIDVVAAAVGVSFGGTQAIAAAVALSGLVPRLALHSCAPSTLPYPDTARERLGGPVAFSPRTQRLTWLSVSTVVKSERGLTAMMRALSTESSDQWWGAWSAADKQAARRLFQTMSSGSGFVLDLRQAHSDRAAFRRHQQVLVPCPTLVTGSRRDGGVRFAHAEDLAATIPSARLVELYSDSHLYWLGPHAPQAQDAVRRFMSEAPVTQ